MENRLTPKEVRVIQIALITMIEDVTETTQNVTIPFTPEARSISKDILLNAKSALEKIAKTSGHAVQLDAYQDGDEKEFLTKQS